MKEVIAILLGIAAYWMVGWFTYDLSNFARAVIGAATMIGVVVGSIVLLDKCTREG